MNIIIADYSNKILQRDVQYKFLQNTEKEANNNIKDCIEMKKANSCYDVMIE